VNVDTLVAAADRALELRGTAMCALRGDENRWGAVCVAVDGSVELRVGEPSRGWRSRRPATGEAWLRDHGFTHVRDAWAAPAPAGAATRVYAETLASALVEALGAPQDGELVDVLLHPGILGDAPPPAPSAPHGEHVRYAVGALAGRRSGKLSLEGGRPASTWAWAFAGDGSLVLSPETADEWTVGLDGADVAAEAGKLTAALAGEPGYDAGEPLFVTFMDA
jgi:hypothetical protein